MVGEETDRRLIGFTFWNMIVTVLKEKQSCNSPVNACENHPEFVYSLR